VTVSVKKEPLKKSVTVTRVRKTEEPKKKSVTVPARSRFGEGRARKRDIVAAIYKNNVTVMRVRETDVSKRRSTT
jgi:hypothetical protein